MDGLLGNLFGYQEEDPLLALLPPEQRQLLMNQARGQGMTNLGLALLQAGGPSRTPTGIGSRLGQAGIQAMQANQGVMDRGLERMLAARKLQQEESQRSLREQAISALSPDEQTIARLDPSALGEIYKTRLGIGGKGQAQLMSTAEAESLGLSPNVRYQRLPDGKIIAVEGTQAVNPEEVKPTLQDRDAYASSMFGGKTFYQLTPQEQEAVNKRIEQLGLERASATAPKPPSRQPSFTDATDLRKEFRSTPEFKAFQELKAAYSTVENASKLKTPVADVALATKIMKLLDPGSVVRESELAIAMGAAAPLDRILGYAERLKTGQKLTDTQREEFRILAKRVFDAATQSFDQTKNYYAGVARLGGLAPDLVIGGTGLPRGVTVERVQ